MPRLRVLKPSFRASLRNDGVLELLCYDEIGENFWTGGGVTAQSVKEQIDSAGTYSSITLRINSPGGDAFEGVAIHSVLRAQQKPVNSFIDGIAASAASIIAMAGDTITMASGATMMIHDAWSMCIGNAKDMTKMADTLARVSTSIAQVYVDRTGLPLDEIQSLMGEESWLSAQDCLDKGFATAVSKHENRAAMALAGTFKALIDGKRFALRNVPEQLKPKGAAKNDEDIEDDACVCNCQSCVDGDCSSCTHDACDCEGCDGCPQKETGENVDPAENAGNLSQYEARLALLGK